jgi:uncharacterized membrane protein YkvA (DUF1232 family)
MGQWENWKKRAKSINDDIYALYLAYRDRRVPWYAKLWILIVAGYAFSPIDLIPDFIPILGYLDDLILLPLGIALAIRWVPPRVLAECRERAKLRGQNKPRNWVAGLIILAVWGLLLAWIFLRFL